MKNTDVPPNPDYTKIPAAAGLGVMIGAWEAQASVIFAIFTAVMLVLYAAINMLLDKQSD